MFIWYVQLVKSIRTPIFSFFGNIVISEVGPVSNESVDKFTLLKNNVFFSVSFHNFTENSVKWQLQHKNCYFSKTVMFYFIQFLNPHNFEKN